MSFSMPAFLFSSEKLWQKIFSSSRASKQYEKRPLANVSSLSWGLGSCRGMVNCMVWGLGVLYPLFMRYLWSSFSKSETWISMNNWPRPIVHCVAIYLPIYISIYTNPESKARRFCKIHKRSTLFPLFSPPGVCVCVSFPKEQYYIYIIYIDSKRPYFNLEQ